MGTCDDCGACNLNMASVKPENNLHLFQNITNKLTKWTELLYFSCPSIHTGPSTAPLVPVFHYIFHYSSLHVMEKLPVCGSPDLEFFFLWRSHPKVHSPSKFNVVKSAKEVAFWEEAMPSKSESRKPAAAPHVSTLQTSNTATATTMQQHHSDPSFLHESCHDKSPCTSQPPECQFRPNSLCTGFAFHHVKTQESSCRLVRMATTPMEEIIKSN